MTSITSDSPRPVCQVDGLVSGFPCTSASCLNMSAQGFQDHSSATGGGFHNVNKYVRRKRPQFCVLENVAALTFSRKVDKGAKPINLIVAEMEKLGYVCTHDLVNTMWYGLPQSRTKLWMMFLRRDAIKNRMSDPCQSLLSTFRNFRLHYCGLSKVLMGGCDDGQKIPQGASSSRLKWHEKFRAAKEKLGAVLWPSKLPLADSSKVG